MNTEITGQPDLARLLSNYLQRQKVAHGLGLATLNAIAEVVPHEAGPVQPIDARLAWDEAVVPLRLFVPNERANTLPAPPSWPTLVAIHEPAFALALSVANFPQLVRDLHPLLHATSLTELRPAASQPLAVPGLSEWVTQFVARKQFPQTLLAVGTLRLAKHFDQAADLLRDLDSDVPGPWRSAWANEQAALAWQRGRAGEARASWLAQPPSVPVQFNRGMAALFLGDPKEARSSIPQALAGLAEDGAWYHLGRLYLALAEART
jgi:hypothetical protein